MIPALSKKSILFLFLGIFALLFGMAQSASAVDCQDGAWNVEPSCNETLQYNDLGGSQLSICEYRVVSVNDAGGVEQTFPASGWTSAGNCSGATPPWTSPTISISIGFTSNCKDEGQLRCFIYERAQDNSRNKSTNYDTTGTVGHVYHIDYTTPATSIQCNGSACTGGWYNADVSISLSTNTLKGSPDKLFECHDTTTCTPELRNTGNLSASHSFLLSTEGITPVRYQATDVAGHEETIRSQQVKIDKTAPTVVSFDVNPKKSEGKWVNAANPNVAISWQVRDFVSGLKEVQVWRSGDGGNTWQQIPGSPFVAATNDWTCTSCVTDSPDSGNYKYGIHVKDKAENKITETEAGFTTIEVRVDKSGPTSSVINPPESSTQRLPGFDATFQYSDLGGSNLTTCEYKVQSKEVVTLDWDSAGTCSGAGPVDLVKQITVGSNPPRDCRDEGTNACTIFVRATDVAGNVGSEGSRPFTIALSQPSANPTSLSQFKNDGTTTIPNGGLTNESNVKLKASTTDPDANEVVRLFFEVALKAGSFASPATPTTGTSCVSGTAWSSCSNKIWYVASSSGNFSSTPFTGTASIAGLSTGAGYKWQVKACDDDNACSSWVAFNTTTPNFLVNASPIANAQAVDATEDIPRAITLTGSDIETCDLTFSIVGNPSRGTLGSIVNSSCAPGTPNTDVVSITYTPAHNLNGSDTFTFKVNDGTADSNVATVTITVQAVNDAPVANSGTLTTNEDTQGTGTLSASDVDGASLTYSIVANGAKGTAAITNTSTGAYAYTPTLNLNGSDSFTFKVNDGTVNSNTATVSVTITAVNDTPSFAKGANQTVLESAGAQTVADWATSISPGPPDESGQTVNFLVSNDNSGLFAAQPAISANGILTYTPAPNVNGSATVTVQIHDDGGIANGGVDTSAAQTFTITASDGKAPTVTSFTINGNSCSGTACNAQVVVNSTFTIAWTGSESGGSFLSNAKAYNAVFQSGSCDNNTKSGCSWNQVGSTQSAPASANSWSSSMTHNPSDNTYWYGIHISDNAGNCITEDTGGTDNGHCAGVTSDSLDTRTDRGPIKVKMQHNSSPTIQGNVGISPAPPVKALVELTFSVDWNDPDAGEQVKIHICKDVLSGTSCNAQGSWCASSSFTTNDPATCTYTTLAADGGDKAYNAYVCDDENACSPSKSGTFLVDATAPAISTWSIVPESPNWADNVNPSIKVSWSVLDQGGSFLDRVEIFRVLSGPGCNDTDKFGCVWGSPIGSVNASPSNNDWTCTDCFTNDPGSGTWWYGIHVFDKAQNETVEPTPPGPKKALVDTVNPSTAVTLPAAGAWFKDNFNATLDDSDTGGSGLATGASGCQYKFTGINVQGQDALSGDIARTCGSSVIKNISVGASPDICRYQGVNTCKVETKAFDVAGNTSGWQQRSFNVDFSAPTINAPSPAAAQSGVSTQFTSTSLQDVVGHITGCTFYTTNDNWTTWTLDPTTVSVNPSGDGESGSVSANHTFAAAGSYEARFSCSDAAGNTGWGAVSPIQVESLSVDLSAVPPAGSVNTLFDLVATVSGTMTGPINYKFDCTNDGTWELEVNNQTQNPYTAVDLCQYASLGTYTAKVFVQRGVGTAQDTTNIPVSANSIPSQTNLSVDPANPTDYFGAIGFPPVRVRWVFSDADPGDMQSAYEIEVFQGGTKVVDTGKRLGSTQSYVFQSAGEQLLWNTTYTWQVRVWDSQDDPSAFATGPQFTTPKHHYPVPNFTWTPALPGAQESVQFTDQTNFAAESTGKTWSWNFADPDSGVNNTSSLQNPSHTFTKTGAFGVTLQSTDDVGSVSTQKTVNISIPFPEWQEISPF